MKKAIILYFTLIQFLIFSEEIVTLNDGRKAILYDDNTWTYYEDSNLSTGDLVMKNQTHLRQGISASEEEIAIACEMYEQGWTYTMPRPKSSQAAWGNSDGRTTWYNGWWHNSKTDHYSSRTPQKTSSGLYLGDGQNNAHTWSRGGSPRRPDIYMYLLSQRGGPRY